MTLPASGSISLSQVNTELSRSPTQTISLNETPVRQLAGALSGSIGFNNLLGKSAWNVSLSPSNSEDAGDSTIYDLPLTCVGALSGSTFNWTLSNGTGSWSFVSPNSLSTIGVRLSGAPANSRLFITVSCSVTKDGVTKVASGNYAYTRLGIGGED